MDVFINTSPPSQAPTWIPLFAGLVGALIGGALALIGGAIQRAADQRNKYADKLADVAHQSYMAEIKKDRIKQLRENAASDLKRARDRYAQAHEEHEVGLSNKEEFAYAEKEMLRDIDKFEEETKERDRRWEEVVEFSNAALFMAQLHLPYNLMQKLRAVSRDFSSKTLSDYTISVRYTVEDARLSARRRRKAEKIREGRTIKQKIRRIKQRVMRALT